MKKIMSSLIAGAMIGGLFCSTSFAGIKGNGLPPGQRYMLNIIGYENCPAGDFTDSNRHMIAVQAGFGENDFYSQAISNQAGSFKRSMIKENTIALTQTPEGSAKDFQVLDGNACSKGGAEFMLPTDPYLCDKDGDGLIDDEMLNDPECINEELNFQEYKVYIRLVGRANTGVGITTCADAPIDIDGDGLIDDEIILCSTESVVKLRSKGKVARFEDVSTELLTICLDTEDDGNLDGNCDVRYALFDPALQDYFWQWNTVGKAHAQLVFIPMPD